MKRARPRYRNDSVRVSADTLQRFAGKAIILDEKAFIEELDALLQETIAQVGKLQSLSRHHLQLHSESGPAASPEVLAELSKKVASLKASKTWKPSTAAIQRGRAILMEVYNESHNLRVQQFASLAGKSRQQIYRDLEQRKLLALNAGGRGQKLPDWQLDPLKRLLTEKVLKGAASVDSWTLYRALSEPLDALEGRAPIDAVTSDGVDLVAEFVFGSLSID